MEGFENLIRQLKEYRVACIPDSRVTINEAAKMCGMSRTAFNGSFRKSYDIGESTAFSEKGGKVTFSMHKLQLAIWKHQEKYESQYKTQ